MRAIDADQPKLKVHKVCNYPGRVYERDIDVAPTLDVAPVVHAHWIPCENETGEGSNTYKCSACGEIQMLVDGTPKDNDWNFCPHCGAKMAGETNE